MSATPRATSVIEHEVRIGARPETVFAYFTDPAKMVQWMGAEATLEPRPGGVCRIAFRMGRELPTATAEFLASGAEGGEPPERPEFDGISVMLGEFVEVDPPRRITFTWGWELEVLTVPPQSTSVEVSFTPDGESTVVRLVHRRLPAATVGFHRAGWEHFLPRLAIVAAGRDPGPDPWQGATP